jgi:hypothetical protein
MMRWCLLLAALFGLSCASLDGAPDKVAPQSSTQVHVRFAEEVFSPVFRCLPDRLADFVGRLLRSHGWNQCGEDQETTSVGCWMRAPGVLEGSMSKRTQVLIVFVGQVDQERSRLTATFSEYDPVDDAALSYVLKFPDDYQDAYHNLLKDLETNSECALDVRSP